jgi:hypothetical protein
MSSVLAASCSLGSLMSTNASTSCCCQLPHDANPALHCERDLIREGVNSGLAAARARGVKLGRPVGQRPSDKKAKRVLGMHADGLSYRLIARNVGLSKNTVMNIVRRNSGELRA